MNPLLGLDWSYFFQNLKKPKCLRSALVLTSVTTPDDLTWVIRVWRHVDEQVSHTHTHNKRYMYGQSEISAQHPFLLHTLMCFAMVTQSFAPLPCKVLSSKSY